VGDGEARNERLDCALASAGTGRTAVDGGRDRGGETDWKSSAIASSSARTQGRSSMPPEKPEVSMSRDRVQVSGGLMTWGGGAACGIGTWWLVRSGALRVKRATRS